MATFSFLRSINVTLDQCQVLFEAFSPSLIHCELESTWSSLIRGKSKKNARATLMEDAVQYLRTRLRITPPQIYAMTTTHSRLSMHSQKVLQSHIDTLQNTLRLSSEEVRQLCIKSPSVLGIATATVEERVAFLVETVGLDVSLVRKIVLASSSVLQNKIESNTAPKVEFLTEEIGISIADLGDVLNQNPYILSASLDNKLRPIVDGLFFYGLTMDRISSLVVKEPNILSFAWQTSLLPKMKFFSEQMMYEEAELQQLLTNMPKILTFSIQNIAEMVKMMEDTLKDTRGSLAKVIVDNPSLLILTKARLQQRLILFSKSDGRFEDFIAPKEKRKQKKVVLRRRTKPVTEFDNTTSTVGRTFESISQAAAVLGTGYPNMCRIIKSGRVFNECVTNLVK